MYKILAVIVSAVVGLLGFAASTAVCAWPALAFLHLYRAVGPHGFWEKLAVLGLGAYALAGMQVVFVAIWVAAVVGCWVVGVMVYEKLA